MINTQLKFEGKIPTIQKVIAFKRNHTKLLIFKANLTKVTSFQTHLIHLDA